MKPFWSGFLLALTVLVFIGFSCGAYFLGCRIHPGIGITLTCLIIAVGMGVFTAYLETK